jgi:hypothetical protein
MREMITMSAKELDRLTVLERISRKGTRSRGGLMTLEPKGLEGQCQHKPEMTQSKM